MPFVEIAQESFEIALVLGRCVVVGFFKLGVADKGFAVFAPVFRLDRHSQQTKDSSSQYVPTVDFQYSDMVANYENGVELTGQE